MEIVVIKGQWILEHVPKYKNDFSVHFFIKKMAVPKGLPFDKELMLC